MTLSRRILPVAVAALAALTLAGCAGNNAPEPNPTAVLGVAPSSTETASATPETTEQAAPSTDDIAGTWCPTDDSPASAECFTVELPDLMVDGGPAWLETDALDDGKYQLSLTDESGPLLPYGVYVPAGVTADITDAYTLVDLPEQDRIFNGQTGELFVRA